MKRTVEREVTVERDVTVCDECGREVDHDHGATEVDLCSLHYESLVGDQPPDTVLTLDEWRGETGFDPLNTPEDMVGVSAKLAWLAFVLTVGALGSLLAMDGLVVPVVSLIVLAFIAFVWGVAANDLQDAYAHYDAIEGETDD